MEIRSMRQNQYLEIKNKPNLRALAVNIPCGWLRKVQQLNLIKYINLDKLIKLLN